MGILIIWVFPPIVNKDLNSPFLFDFFIVNSCNKVHQANNLDKLAVPTYVALVRPTSI